MKHIFALEGEWVSNMRRKDSIEPALKLLEQVCDIKHVFRKVATIHDFRHYLKRTTNASLSKDSIIYLAFHGKPGLIQLGDSTEITVDEIAEEFPALFADKIVHFGSCSTLRMNEEELKEFKKISGARLVSGYTKDIDFIDSTILDVAYFNQLQYLERVGVIGKRMYKLYPGLCERLGFVTV